MIQHMRVGIIAVGERIFTGGPQSIKKLVADLISLPILERPGLYLIINNDNLSAFDLYRPFIDLFDGIIFVGRNSANATAVIGRSFIHFISYEELLGRIDLLYQVVNCGQQLLCQPLALVLSAEVSAQLPAGEFCRLVEQAQFPANRNPQMKYSQAAGCRAGITVATSLAPGKDLNDQRQAVDSWKKQGFKVISVNVQKEIQILAPHFPEVEFVTAERDAGRLFGRPFVFIDDLLTCLAVDGAQICGIINSDIHILAKDFYKIIAESTSGALVYGARTDVKGLSDFNGTVPPYGYDYFFFDRRLISYYPETELCIGLPIWDYWLPLVPLFYRIPVKKIIGPKIYHVQHPVAWDNAILRDLYNNNLARYLQPLTAAVRKAVYLYAINLVEKYSIGVPLTNNFRIPRIDSGCQEIKRLAGGNRDIRIIDELMFIVSGGCQSMLSGNGFNLVVE